MELLREAEIVNVKDDHADALKQRIRQQLEAEVQANQGMTGMLFSDAHHRPQTAGAGAGVHADGFIGLDVEEWDAGLYISACIVTLLLASVLIVIKANLKWVLFLFLCYLLLGAVIGLFLRAAEIQDRGETREPKSAAWYFAVGLNSPLLVFTLLPLEVAFFALMVSLTCFVSIVYAGLSHTEQPVERVRNFWLPNGPKKL